MSRRFRNPLVHTFYRRILPGFICGLLLVTGLHAPVVAQGANINRAEITQILDSPQVFIQNKQAKVKDAASSGQRVRTGKARAQIQFNTGAVGRLAPNSVLTVGQKCARLRSGSLLVNGAMNGCASSVVAGVRGTTYLLEVGDTGDAKITVLEGEVSVNRMATPLPNEDEAEPTAANKQLPPLLPPIPLPEVELPVSTTFEPLFPLPDPTYRLQPGILQVEESLSDSTPILKVETGATNIVLKEGEKVSVRPDGNLGLVEKLSQEEFTQLLKGGLFNGFSIPLPGIGKVQQSFQRLFPGVPFPISIPSLPLPSVPTPPIGIPLPF